MGTFTSTSKVKVKVQYLTMSSEHVHTTVQPCDIVLDMRPLAKFYSRKCVCSARRRFLRNAFREPPREGSVSDHEP